MLTRPYLCSGLVWFDLIWGTSSVVKSSSKSVSVIFLRETLRLHLTLSIAQEPSSQSKNVSYWPTYCRYSQCPLKLEYLIMWPSKYTSGQPQVSCLKMPMLLCVEPGRLPGSFVPSKAPRKQNWVGFGLFFFPSILYPSTADWCGLPKVVSPKMVLFENVPNWVHLQSSRDIQQTNHLFLIDGKNC